MEQQLKNRLIGATVLVTLGVILIPMALSPPEKTGEIVIDVVAPPKPDNAYRSRIIPLDGLNEGEPAEEFEWPDIGEQLEVESEMPVTPLPATQSPPTKPVIKVASEPDRQQEVSVKKAAPPKTVASKKQDLPPQPRKATVAVPTKPKQPLSLKAWAVQVGSFTEQKNALGLRDRLRAKGYRAFVKSVKGGNATTTTRVFVGPTLRRDDALRANKKIHDDLAIKGIVIRHSEGR
ncbi:MAG: SPOR domain-containing protein [Gammaproteobacteria bacterium]|nr:SPOR domain-containing protein [Gammaproteobacteria bacterium]NNJ83810.1 hypothetical protein [Gammaproteobacteria bacterium]